MLRGSCLCGAVRWQVDGPVSPVECCHCTRCRKASGAACLPMVAARTRDFRFTEGEGSVRVFALPVRQRPPAYRRSFCDRCGSLVPGLDPDAARLELPAGALDDDPGTRTLQHIYTDLAAAWYVFSDGLPRHPRHPPARERAWRALDEEG